MNEKRLKKVIFTAGMHLIYSPQMGNYYICSNILSHKLSEVESSLASKDPFSKMGEVKRSVLQHPAKRKLSQLGKVSSRHQEQGREAV